MGTPVFEVPTRKINQNQLSKGVFVFQKKCFLKCSTSKRHIASTGKVYGQRFVYICRTCAVRISIRWASDYETVIVDNDLSYEILPEKGEDSYPYIQDWLADTPYSASQMFRVGEVYRLFHSYRHNLALIVALLLCESSLLQVFKGARMIWYPYVFYEGLFFSEIFE